MPGQRRGAFLLAMGMLLPRYVIAQSKTQNVTDASNQLPVDQAVPITRPNNDHAAGRPDPPSTVRWTRSGFLHAADGVGQRVDHVAGSDRRLPPGERASPVCCVTGRNTVQERSGRRRLADVKPLGEQ